MIAFLEAKRAGLFRKAHFSSNLLAGVVVGVVALPLALAFTLAPGVDAKYSLYTAIVARVAAAVFGGPRFKLPAQPAPWP